MSKQIELQLPHYQICQVAYFVSDIEEAAHRMVQTFGAGPFFVVREIELAEGEHRGRDCPFVHSSAYGQWGQVMMELVQQDSDGPSPFRDLYSPGQQGLHHTATMVDSLADAYAAYEAAGFAHATRAVTKTGTEFSFMDATATLGHFIEVYERAPGLVGFYDMVASAARDWRGDDPVRML
jgi:hypothetical protein